MVQLTHRGVWSNLALSESAGITDLQSVATAQGLFVVSTSGAYGELAAWQWTGSALLLRDTQALSGTAALAAPGGLAAFDTGAGTGFYSFGGAGRGLEAYDLSASGAIRSLGDQGAGPLTLEAVLPVRGATGDFVFGGARNAPGLQGWQLGPSGLTQGAQYPVGLSGSGTDVPDMAHATLGGQDFIVTTDPGGDGLRAFRIGPNGLTPTDSESAASGLPVNTPTAVETVAMDGVPYVILAAADSNSLTVLRLDPGGGLTPVDHVIDDRNTRFEGVSVLETVQADGRVYVLAAGGDDGITLLTLLPGGRLRALDTIADASGAPLGDITALEATVSGGQLTVFAAGEGFDGLVTLTADLGSAAPRLDGTAGRDVMRGDARNDLIDGGAGDDILKGHGGDDILIDGTGRDTLWGGEGADLFVISRDGDRDRIADFEPGVDRIELVDAGMIYTLQALTWQPLPNGVRITYAGEQLDIINARGTPLDIDDFTLDMLFDLAHFAVGPVPVVHRRLSGTSADELLQGQDGNDTVIGEAGGDVLLGGAGRDLLRGEGVTEPFDTASNEVVRLFQATLDRLPERAGHLVWTDQLQSGALTMREAAGRFVASQEFQIVYGPTSDAEFVTLLYENVLDRAPASAGLIGWTGNLAAGMSRAEVVWRFAESAEFEAATTAASLEFSFAGYQADWSDDTFRLFQAVLGRAPDPSGLMGWSANLAGGMSYLDAISHFVASAEFRAVYGQTTDAQFVTLLYENVLDRAPNAAGLAGWTGNLAAGMSRETVVQHFAQSAEFIQTSRGDLVAFMRNEARDDTLVGETGNDTLFGGALSDSFVFDLSEAQGTDVIADIEPWDWIVLENAAFADASEAFATLRQDGAAVVLDMGGTVIVFSDTTLSDLTEDMFVIA